MLLTVKNISSMLAAASRAGTHLRVRTTDADGSNVGHVQRVRTNRSTGDTEFQVDKGQWLNVRGAPWLFWYEANNTRYELTAGKRTATVRVGSCDMCSAPGMWRVFEAAWTQTDTWRAEFLKAFTCDRLSPAFLVGVLAGKYTTTVEPDATHGTLVLVAEG